jgi:hypothetical protein
MPGPTPTQQQCLDAVKTIVAGLTVTGVSFSVVEQLEDDESNLQFPVVRLSLENEAEELERLTSASRLWGYPVRVDFEDTIPPPGTDQLASWNAWRDAVAAAFPEHRLPAYPAGVTECQVRPGAVSRGGQGNQRVRGTLTLVFKAVRQVY